MTYNGQPGRLRNAGTYLSKAFKFYDLKNEYLTRIIFIVILFISFAGQMVMYMLNPGSLNLTYPVNEADMEKLIHYLFISAVINLAANLLAYLVSTIYLSAYIKELKAEEYSFRSCLKLVVKNTFRIFAAFLIYIFGTAIGGLLFIIPGLVVYVTYLFNTCYIIDRNAGIPAAFKLSKNITFGCRMSIFGIILVLNLILIVAVSLIGATKSFLIFAFVASFLSTIFNMIYQRLVALMYVDLEYKRVSIEPSP